MREILFRGKWLHNGEWFEGYLVRNYLEEGDAYIFCPHGAYYRVDPATVGQYTGMKDKNGKRIFEGDIVVDIDTGNIKTVEYHGCRFVFVSLLRHFYHAFYEEDWEIIGNIHDNRELLGGTE